MLREAIPHSRRAEEDEEVAFSGELQLKVAPSHTRPLIVVQPPRGGLNKAGPDRLGQQNGVQARQFTAAVTVALEVSSGTGDAKADFVKGSGGAKRVSGEASTSRVQAADLDCGRTHGLVLVKEEGKPSVVRGWGGNASGQLGLGHFSSGSPTMSLELSLLRPLKVERVHCGWDFSMVMLEGGRVMCWGANESGQLGLGLSGAKWREQERGCPYANVLELVPGSGLALCGMFREEHLVEGWECGRGNKVSVKSILGKIDESSLGIMDLIENDLHMEKSAREARVRELESQRSVVQAELDGLLASWSALDQLHAKQAGELWNKRAGAIVRLTRTEIDALKGVEEEETILREKERQASQLSRHKIIGEGDLMRNAAYHRVATIYNNATRRIVEGDIGLGRRHGYSFKLVVTVIGAKFLPRCIKADGERNGILRSGIFCRASLGFHAAHETRAVRYKEGEKQGLECSWEESFDFVSGPDVDDEKTFPQIREPFFSPLLAAVRFWEGHDGEKVPGEVGRAKIMWPELEGIMIGSEGKVFERELWYDGTPRIDEASGNPATIILRVRMCEDIQVPAGGGAGQALGDEFEVGGSVGDNGEQAYRVVELGVRVMKGHHLPKKDWLMGKCDAYCKVSVPGLDDKKTDVKKGTYEPEWNQDLSFPWPPPGGGGGIRCQVMDWDRFSMDDVIGGFEISMEFIQMMVKNAELNKRWERADVKERLVREGRGEIIGHDGKFAELSVVITARGMMRIGGGRDVVEHGTHEHAAGGGAGVGGGVGINTEVIPIMVSIVGVYNLPKMDVVGTCDPYVVLHYGSAEARTGQTQSGYNVEFNENFTLSTPSAGESLKLTVFDHDWTSKDDLVGEAVVSASELSVLSLDGRSDEMRVKVLLDGKQVKGHESGPCEIVVRLSRISIGQAASSISRTQNAERRLDREGLDNYMVELLDIRPSQAPFSAPPNTRLSMNPHVALQDLASSFGIIHSSPPERTELSCDSGNRNAVQISIPKGEQGALVLKIFEIRGRQNERTCVGNCKIDLKFSADSEEGAIGGCSVMWLSCHDEIVGGGKTRSGGENGPEDSSTTVDIMVRVFFGGNKHMSGLKEMSELERKMKGAVENARRYMAIETDLAWKMCDRDIKNGFREWMRTSRLTRVQKKGLKNGHQGFKVFAYVADLSDELQEKLAADVAYCKSRHLAARQAYAVSDQPIREPWQVDRDCEERVSDLEEVCSGRIREWEEATEALAGIAMKDYRGFLDDMNEERRIHRIRVDNALCNILRQAEEKGKRMIDEGESKAIEMENQASEFLSNQLKEAKNSRKESLVRFENSRDTAIESRERGVIETDESWKEESSQLANKQNDEIEGLCKGERECELQGKLSSLAATITDVKGSSVFLHTLVPPSRSGGQSPPRIEEYTATSIPLDLLQAKNQPSPLHLWALTLASGGGCAVAEMSCGANHVVAILTNQGGMWAWGGNERGQLGRGDRQSWCIPKKVADDSFGGGRAQGVSCGDSYTMCLSGGSVWGWGRNDQGQLGHNQGREIWAWLRGLATKGVLLNGAAGWVRGMQQSDVNLWCQLQRLKREQVRKIGLLGGCPQDEWITVCESIALINAEFKDQNHPVNGSDTRWLYSAGDHLRPCRVAQGLFIARDGRVYEHQGFQVSASECTCEDHAGVPVNTTPMCSAHGQPLGWSHDMTPLHVFPPAYRGAERVPVARPGDSIRVGVYPQDPGLLAGDKATEQAGLRNVQDGPQHGSAWVEQQVSALQDLISDPLTTATVSVHFDGAVHFPFFHPGCKGVKSLRCGEEYTIAVLDSGELRFLGDVKSALGRLERKQPSKSHRSQGVPEVRMEQPKVAAESTGMHMGVLGENAKMAATYSPPALKENMLIRAVRGGQQPRGLIRLSLSQLHRLSFPHHL